MIDNILFDYIITFICHNRSTTDSNKYPIIVHTLVTKRRKVEYWTQGVKAKVRAALVIPEDLMQRVEKITDPILKKRLKEFFEGVKVINFSGDMLPSQMKLTELTRGNLFRAHDDEKPANVRFRLTVGE